MLAEEDFVLNWMVHLMVDSDLAYKLRDLVDSDGMCRDFASANPGFWDDLTSRADQLGLGRPLYYSLRYASQLLETPVPDEAKQRAQEARKKLNKQIKMLASFLRNRPDVRLYYVEATASIAGQGRELSPELTKVLLADAGFKRAFGLVRQIQKERRLLMAPEAKDLQQLLGNELDGRLVKAQERAGQTVKRLLASTLVDSGGGLG